MKLIVASNNAHKLEEARAIMPDIQILSLAEIGCHEDIPETRPTLEGNSLQKATFVRDWCLSHPEHIPADVAGCFADDTGLEIDALNGEPGVYTARWAGPSCNPGSNRKKALALLAGETRSTARFRTIVTLLPLCSSPEPLSFEGIVTGRITTEERGDGAILNFEDDGHTQIWSRMGVADARAVRSGRAGLSCSGDGRLLDTAGRAGSGRP